MSSRDPAPTVVYDIERPSSSHSTTSDFSAIIHSKRHWTQRFHSAFNPSFSRPIQVGSTCFSITASALQANGVYCWGTYGPVVAKLKELDGTEAQTIVIGGIIGVYVMAAPLGYLTDKWGPRVGSLISACFSAAGYLSFSLILTNSTAETPYLYLWLTLSYFLVGAATVGSYFACLTCASLSFPKYPTLSLSLPLSLIGLSALAISSFSALPYFLSPTTHDLDPAKFLFFLGILSPCINIWGSIFMRILPEPLPESNDEDDDDEPMMTTSQLLNLNEHTPLLIGGRDQAMDELEEQAALGKSRTWGVRDLLMDYKGFWAFGILSALVIGPGEMVIASIGSIITSLLPTPIQLLTIAPSPLELRNKHVFLISLSSTLFRLITGLLADFLAPPATAFPNPRHESNGGTDSNEPTHIYKQVKKIRVTRSAFTFICATVLGAVFAWSSGWMSSEKGLVIVSVGVGGMYGALFTLTPAIISHHFGPTNFGLAWGMISYFAAVGSVVYSYLYAILSTPGSETTCHGTVCFRTTFIACAVSCVVGGMGLWILGRRWKV